MNITVLMFFQISVLSSFGYIPTGGISWSKSRSIFNFLKYFHTDFHSGCPSLHSHQQCKRVSFSPIPRQQPTLCFDLLMIIILIGVMWYVIVVLIFISLMISDIEHLFMCLLVICVSSLEKHLFRSFANFLIGSFGIFWCWVL